MTFLEMVMKKLGRSTQHNTHNTRSLIRTLKYVQNNAAGGRNHRHTHTHTHTHTHLPAVCTAGHIRIYEIEIQFIKLVLNWIICT